MENTINLITLIIGILTAIIGIPTAILATLELLKKIKYHFKKNKIKGPKKNIAKEFFKFIITIAFKLELVWVILTAARNIALNKNVITISCMIIIFFPIYLLLNIREKKLYEKETRELANRLNECKSFAFKNTHHENNSIPEFFSNYLKKKQYFND